VAASVGLHPNDAGTVAGLEARLAPLEQLARDGGFAAVGETGLDFYRDSAEPAAQERALLQHLDWARELGLPVILHCRQAAARLAQLVAPRAPLRGVMHCFSEGPEWVEPFLACGLHVSFAGNLSYPKSEALRAAARAVPRDRILLETDAPFLAPQPRRGRPNEPAFLPFTLSALAAARGEEPEGLAATTWDNACALFGPPTPG
jgi:TatD DNase family protein